MLLALRGIDNISWNATLLNIVFASLLRTAYSETCVRKPPLRLTLVVDVERWLSYKGTCHVILLAKLVVDVERWLSY